RGGGTRRTGPGATPARRAGAPRRGDHVRICGGPDCADGPERVVRDNGIVSEETAAEIPRRAVSRSARLAGLPLGFAGRAVLGIGKRMTGIASEVVSSEIQQRTADHLFRVLGQLKGGAMKFGQALSIFEAALPEELAGPYRQALTKLQEAAPPMPVATVHRVLTEELGPRWRSRFIDFEDTPAAAASI